MKNLRGVVLADIDDEGVWQSIQWLIKRFRYRDLGVIPSIVRMYGGKLKGYLNGNPFVELVPPVKPVEEFAEMLSKALQLGLEVAELLVYSSVYISPAILVGDRYLGTLLKISADAVYTCKDMSVSDWKLHLRIADYTILDFYRGCVDEVLKVLQLESNRVEELKKIVEDRRSRIKRDKKRYWRIACDSGRVFMIYIDMASLALEHNIVEYLEPIHAASLAIVPVVFVPQGMK